MVKSGNFDYMIVEVLGVLELVEIVKFFVNCEDDYDYEVVYVDEYEYLSILVWLDMCVTVIVVGDFFDMIDFFRALVVNR